METKMIKADNLFKADAFNNISFETDSGILCVLSKKAERSSALLDTLVGVKKADGGELSGIESAGYLSRGCPLPKNITADEYIKLVSDVKNRAVVPEKTVSLTEEFSNEYIASLSALERITLGVAAALIGNPSVIALEEPYHGLSYEEYGDLKELLLSVSAEVPVVFSSGSVFESKEISDKILVMSSGNQVYFGKTETLFENEINETDICCLVKGEEETIIAVLEKFYPIIEDTTRQDVYSVTVKGVPMFKASEARAKIKKALSKAKISLLEIKSDREALLNIIGELTDKDRRKKAELDEIKPEKVTKITKNLVAFSHDEDEESGDDEESESGEENSSYMDEASPDASVDNEYEE